ncbi:hypothetical protein PENSPDRAFT_668582 [Peniophora sp. CONT]|nr:hypothetical protein PENSPDRAFT_668582 [Peniophora sp. CONT]
MQSTPGRSSPDGSQKEFKRHEYESKKGANPRICLDPTPSKPKGSLSAASTFIRVSPCAHSIRRIWSLPSCQKERAPRSTLDTANGRSLDRPGRINGGEPLLDTQHLLWGLASSTTGTGIIHHPLPIRDRRAPACRMETWAKGKGSRCTAYARYVSEDVKPDGELFGNWWRFEHGGCGECTYSRPLRIACLKLGWSKIAHTLDPGVHWSTRVAPRRGLLFRAVLPLEMQQSQTTLLAALCKRISDTLTDEHPPGQSADFSSFVPPYASPVDNGQGSANRVTVNSQCSQHYRVSQA